MNRTVTSAPRTDVPALWAAPARPSTRLTPSEDFPTELAELELAEVQVLHSRVCRELEHEYLADPGGAHPVTLDRLEELESELTTREDYEADPTR